MILGKNEVLEKQVLKMKFGNVILKMHPPMDCSKVGAFFSRKKFMRKYL
ncbi:hypothetical protein [Clostridium weizhouense]|uniref:Uncharacterized protein n=1 Tax=Clostridium weizhouense TaxID=2859781 RepID=A0ABS7AQT0_9CLOT|nr:hypothetical protein [Clostridium weizhouense]MBW6411022.1 hypothetical protein [Clostridium weizhouense]